MITQSAIIYDAIDPKQAAIVESSIPVGSITVLKGGEEWIRPIEDVIRRRYDMLSAPFPNARKSIGQNLRVLPASAVWRIAGEDSGQGWHSDQHPKSHIWAFWYGGEFEGGDIETEAGIQGVRRNSILAFPARDQHRVLPVSQGMRLSIQFILNRDRRFDQ